MSAPENGGFFCEICNQLFDANLLYACIEGHSLCQPCFEREYNRGERCPNLNNDASFVSLPILMPEDEASGTSNVLFLGSVFNSPLSEPDTSISDKFVSSRPLRCPLKKCNRTITMTMFDTHFQFEHRSVEFIRTTLETRNALNLSCNDVILNEILCVAVLKLLELEDLSRASSSSVSVKSSILTPELSFVIMATRFTLYQNIDDFDKICFDDEKFIFWVASNTKTKYRYTIVLSSECTPVRLKYCGPILLINEDPQKLCLNGKGLILNKFQSMQFTNNGKKQICLDILIHSVNDAFKVDKL